MPHRVVADYGQLELRSAAHMALYRGAVLLLCHTAGHEHLLVTGDAIELESRLLHVHLDLLCRSTLVLSGDGEVVLSIGHCDMVWNGIYRLETEEGDWNHCNQTCLQYAQPLVADAQPFSVYPLFYRGSCATVDLTVLIVPRRCEAQELKYGYL
jgi:hypothetical protein